MKKFALLLSLFLLLAVGCEKEHLATPFPKTTITFQDSTVTTQPTPGPGLDTFMIHVFRDYGSPCTVAQNTPAEVGIGIDWFFLGEFTTIGVFAWDFDEFIVCEDSIHFVGNELFIYVNDGNGKVEDFWITELNGSAPYTVDTIFRTQLFPNSVGYQSDTTRLGYKIYNYGQDLKLSVDSILVIRPSLSS